MGRRYFTVTQDLENTWHMEMKFSPDTKLYGKRENLKKKVTHLVCQSCVTKVQRGSNSLFYRIVTFRHHNVTKYCKTVNI